MSEFEHRPLVEHYEDSHQKPEKPSMLELENLDKDLKGARETEGPEAVRDALAQIATGHAQSKELMAWIDDLRDPDRHDPAPVIPDGFLHDFEADTERAGGALDDPKNMDDGAPPAAAADNTDTSGGDDDDYFFSATRKRKLEGDEDDADAPADGEVKPADVKAPKAKTSKKS